MRGCLPTHTGSSPKKSFTLAVAAPEVKIELSDDKLVRVEHLENMLNEFDDLYSNEKSLLRPNLALLTNSRERKQALDNFFEKLESKASHIMNS